MKSNRRGADEDDDDSMDEDGDLSLMGVDEAIIHCIEKCGEYSANTCQLTNFGRYKL